MKTFVLLLLTIVFATSIEGQNSFQKNDVYLEAGGNGIFGSINYERQFTDKPGVGFRWGIGFYADQAVYFTLPMGLIYLFPLKKEGSFMEAGLGVTWSSETVSTIDYYYNTKLVTFIPSLAYRRHTRSAFMWRISASPLINNKYGITPWIGVSFGKRL